jgi:hypothetical protein
MTILLKKRYLKFKTKYNLGFIYTKFLSTSFYNSFLASKEISIFGAMTKQIKSSRFIVLTLLIIVAASTRALPILVPHIWNFTAVGALAIFAGSQFSDKRFAFIVPLLAMAISDVFIGNGFSPVVYAGFLAMVACGTFIKGRISVSNVGLASITGAVVFYLITNFAFFYPETFYPHNFGGIIQSYIMGLPFLKNMLIADLIFGVALFYGFYLLEKKYPALSLK